MRGFSKLAAVPLLFLALGVACAKGARMFAAAANKTGASSEVQERIPLATAPADITRSSRSHITFPSDSGPVDVYLYARDEKANVLKASYCGGNEGEQEFTGHYELISVKNGAIVSQLPLGPDTFFVSGHPPHDGVHLLDNPASGKALLAVYQYAGCNIEIVYLYRIDSDGLLHQIAFLNIDGRQLMSQDTGPDGSFYPSPEGETIFCSYNNALGTGLCDAYRFEGGNFRQTTSWLGSEHPTATGMARRALYEFLSALDQKDYATAAFYYGDSIGGAEESGSSPSRKIQWLKNYCNSSGAMCWPPLEIRDEGGPAAGSSIVFLVSFLTPESETSIGNETHFPFRVARFENGFKVVNLPPKFPPRPN